jgi:cation:H+ antiporter
MLLEILLIAAGIALLLVGAEVLVRGASTLSLRAGLSPFVVGLTVVAFGTSTPELATSVVAAVQGVPEIAVGNVVGSNIANILLVAGAVAVVRAIPVESRSILRDVLLLAAISALPYLALFEGGLLARWIGILFLLGLAAFIAFMVRDGRVEAPEAPRGRHWSSSIWFSGGLVGVGIALLWVGSGMLVENAVALATALGISELVIGLTIIAIGTSLPELITSLVAALRGRSDLGLGNVIGSGIFNVLGILGVTATLHPVRLSPQVLAFDLPLMIGAALVLAPFILTGRRLSRGEGAAMLAAYAVYLLLLYSGIPAGWFAD